METVFISLQLTNRGVSLRKQIWLIVCKGTVSKCSYTRVSLYVCTGTADGEMVLKYAALLDVQVPKMVKTEFGARVKACSVSRVWTSADSGMSCTSESNWD